MSALACAEHVCQLDITPSWTTSPPRQLGPSIVTASQATLQAVRRLMKTMEKVSLSLHFMNTKLLRHVCRVLMKSPSVSDFSLDDVETPVFPSSNCLCWFICSCDLERIDCIFLLIFSNAIQTSLISQYSHFKRTPLHWIHSQFRFFCLFTTCLYPPIIIIGRWIPVVQPLYEFNHIKSFLL